MKKKSVWLNDERQAPAIYDTHVRTAAEAITLIETGTVEIISLDNDLGDPGGREGRHVALRIEELAFRNAIPRIHCRVHTMNPVARWNMLVSLRSADRYWTQHERE